MQPPHYNPSIAFIFISAHKEKKSDFIPYMAPHAVGASRMHLMNAALMVFSFFENFILHIQIYRTINLLHPIIANTPAPPFAYDNSQNVMVLSIIAAMSRINVIQTAAAAVFFDQSPIVRFNGLERY